MWFDALLHARGLRARDLDDLAFFGVGGALVPADDSVVPATAQAVRAAWEATSAAARRLRRAGLHGQAALGIHPRRIPLRGLEALLAELPGALDRPEVAAIGLVGLDAGGELEERVLARQLEMARALRVPVVAVTPSRAKERITRRVLALLREAQLDPARVLVAGADSRTVKAIRACGYVACVSLAEAPARRAPLDEAVRLVRSLGPEGIALASDAGLAGADLLALALAADRMTKAGLTEAVVRRVCGGNVRVVLGMDAAGERRKGKG
jgi:predicted metal-dependent TIM-barrel fold hydrolase